MPPAGLFWGPGMAYGAVIVTPNFSSCPIFTPAATGGQRLLSFILPCPPPLLAATGRRAGGGAAGGRRECAAAPGRGAGGLCPSGERLAKKKKDLPLFLTLNGAGDQCVLLMRPWRSPQAMCRAGWHWSMWEFQGSGKRLRVSKRGAAQVCSAEGLAALAAAVVRTASSTLKARALRCATLSHAVRAATCQALAKLQAPAAPLQRRAKQPQPTRISSSLTGKVRLADCCRPDPPARPPARSPARKLCPSRAGSQQRRAERDPQAGRAGAARAVAGGSGGGVAGGRGRQAPAGAAGGAAGLRHGRRRGGRQRRRHGGPRDGGGWAGQRRGGRGGEVGGCRRCPCRRPARASCCGLSCLPRACC